MAQHFGHFASPANGGNINPNDLAMNGGYSPSFNNGNNFNSGSGNGPNGYSSGSAVFGDDELLDGLASPPEGHGQAQDFTGMNMGFPQGTFQSHRGSALQIDPSQMNGFSQTPDGDPIQSPYAAGFNAQFRQMQQNNHAMHTPLSFSGSPLASGEMNGDPNDPNFLKARARMSQQMQRKASNTRSPMTPKTNSIHGIPISAQDSPGSFGAHPMRASGSHEKSPSGQWVNNSSGSIPASYNSGFSSPMQPGMVPINEVMLKGGTSMPTKLGGPQGPVSSQEMKRKRRRESHNLVERRRRDNINERIQDLSKLVPAHRLDDEKIRKLIQNGTPLSPTLTGAGGTGQATSGLAGPGARRATSVASVAGNITTGLPIEDKDKGPNKGDILNGSVSWTRDLMWMLHLKLQQQEELMNTIAELGGHFPFELTDDERRMQSELMEAISAGDAGDFSYSRTAGSGLRVPNHTDYRGDPVNSLTANMEAIGISPGEENGAANNNISLGAPADLNDTAQFWNDPDDDGSGNASLNFKEDDEYDMDLTH